MRVYKYLFFLGLALLVACKGEERVPGNVISEERMPTLLADVHIVDGNMFDVPQMPDSLYKFGMGHYLQVFKKHHTDTAEFRRSYAWYVKHPEKLEGIYDKVVIILQKKNDSIAKLPPTVKPLPPPVTKPAVAAPATPAPNSGPTPNAPLKNAVSSK